MTADDPSASQPVSLTSGLGETVLPDPPADDLSAIAGAGEDRDRVAAVVSRRPRLLEGWARLGTLARDPIEAYACYRVGYHRGLDALRAAGWRGSGYVRGRHASNRGFLESLDGLRRTAAELGEDDEAERCALFLAQLDPDWPPEG